jgi:hypothetical protein
VFTCHHEVIAKNFEGGTQPLRVKKLAGGPQTLVSKQFNLGEQVRVKVGLARFLIEVFLVHSVSQFVPCFKLTVVSTMLLNSIIRQVDKLVVQLL